MVADSRFTIYRILRYLRPSRDSRYLRFSRVPHYLRFSRVPHYLRFSRVPRYLRYSRGSRYLRPPRVSRYLRPPRVSRYLRPSRRLCFAYSSIVKIIPLNEKKRNKNPAISLRFISLRLYILSGNRFVSRFAFRGISDLTFHAFSRLRL